MGRRGAAGATPATRALTAAGVEFTLHPYAHDPRATSYGEEAAQALGLEPDAVFKTLVAAVDDGRLVVGIVPVSAQLDLKALARATGGSRAAMAEVKDAERVTGYVAGGISPVGQRRRLDTVLDLSAMSLPLIYVSAGRRGLDMALRPGDLVRVTGAQTADISRW